MTESLGWWDRSGRYAVALREQQDIAIRGVFANEVRPGVCALCACDGFAWHVSMTRQRRYSESVRMCTDCLRVLLLLPSQYEWCGS